MESTGNDLQSDAFWRAHFLKAQEFSGTSDEYCATNGLSKSTFQNHKKRLGFTRVPKTKAAAFVKVAHIPEKVEKLIKPTSPRNLPDAKWVAEFVRLLLG